MHTITVTLRYGTSGRFEVDIPAGTTVRQLLSNQQYRTFLKLPENVSAVVDGQTLSPDDTVNDGDVVLFEKQAASKA